MAAKDARAEVIKEETKSRAFLASRQEKKHSPMPTQMRKKPIIRSRGSQVEYLMIVSLPSTKVQRYRGTLVTLVDVGIDLEGAVAVNFIVLSSTFSDWKWKISSG